MQARHIARWNGSTWSPIETNRNQWTYALAIAGDGLYAGGAFLQAGSVPSPNVGRWSGGAWHALGAGAGGNIDYVNALAVSGSDLYVGGSFRFVAGGALPSAFVARWDGSQWHALGLPNPVGSQGVWALAVSGPGVYVGGDLASFGHLLYHDGQAYQPVGAAGSSGVNAAVSGLLVSGADLYVAGWFTSAGGVPANHIARWDGAAWHSLSSNGGNGTDGVVRAMVLWGEDLYVGGSFTRAGTVPANNLARWDGERWWPVGNGEANGVNGVVRALAISGGRLHVGGNFTHAGGGLSHAFAQWTLPEAPLHADGFEASAR
ncbi:MAG: hypothetical protein JNM64_03135 [Chloroflexia bacterium]|nr:hypothetical protein [Chloroflexia bacterium]